MSAKSASGQETAILLVRATARRIMNRMGGESPLKRAPGSRLRILFPFTGTGVGGSYISAALLAQELQESGEADCIVVLPARGLNTQVFASEGLPPTYYNLPREHIEALENTTSWIRKVVAARATVSAHRLALRSLRESSPDIVHINDDRTMLSWGRAAKRLRIPVVWHIRQRTGTRWLDCCRMRLSDYLIFITQDARSHRLAISQLNHKPNTVIYNAVDDSRFRPPGDRARAKALLGLREDGVVLSYVGTLQPRKRPEWVVRAGIELLQRGRQVQVLVVGGDPTGGAVQRELKVEADRAGYADAFHLLGYRQDMAAILRATDILGLPSIAEPFGRVVIEAMCSGAAVVATSAGGVPEIIDHGVNGLLVSPDDYAGFLAACDSLVLDAGLRQELSQHGLETAKQRFSPRFMGEQVLRVYREILEARQSGLGR